MSDARDLKHTKNHTRSLDEIKDTFPREGVIHDYLDWAHRTTHAPPLFHLGVILPIVAYEANRRGFFLQAADTDATTLRVWTCIAGGSGSGKGSAFWRGQKFAMDYYGKRLEVFEENPPFLSAEGSVSGLVYALADRYYDERIDRTAAILYHEELSKVLLQEAAAEALIMLQDGRTYTRNLRTLQQAAEKDGNKPKDTVLNPCLSAIFTVPSASLEAASTVQHVAGGLYSRLLWINGEVKEEHLMYYEPRHTQLRDKAMKTWMQWGANLDGYEARGIPKAIRMTEDVEQLLVERLFEVLKPRISQNNRLQGVYMRLLNQARVVSAVFAFSRSSQVVSPDDMQQAINLVMLCLETVETLDDTLAVSASYRLQTQILEAVEATGEVGLPLRTIYRRFKLTKIECELAIDSLVAREDVHTFRANEGGKGRVQICVRSNKFADPSGKKKITLVS